MNTDENTDPCSSVVSFCAVYADENPCRVAKDFRRSARRRMENPDASVKSPCPPCLRGETGRLAAAGSLSESQQAMQFVVLCLRMSVWTAILLEAKIAQEFSERRNPWETRMCVL